MALIWAEDFTDKKALAPAWRELVLAKARFEKADSNKAEDFAAAFKAQKTAQSNYESLVSEATQALSQLGQKGQSRTHVLIVGVGKYDEHDASTIPAVTTSVHGARAFAEWALTRFSKDDRPLGSVEFLSSPATGQSDWMPSVAAAERLGFGAAPLTLPDEAATFDNIQQAFNRWLARAGKCADNAAIWYFAGHGLFKSEALLLPQDAELPTEIQPPNNLIAPTTTLYYMQNRPPSVQCFFVDACSETNLELIYNEQERPGRPLSKPPNSAAIPDRDATIYFGSYAGGKAYGPADGPPYFTQELLFCLNQRAGDAGYGARQVTMGSLSTALKAAALHRAELENNFDIKFSESKPGVISFNAQLSELPGPVEVLVRVTCAPKEAMPTAKLFVESGEKRVNRTAPRMNFWCTPVGKGKWTASADFDPPTSFKGVPQSFEAVPPVTDVSFKAQ